MKKIIVTMKRLFALAIITCSQLVANATERFVVPQGGLSGPNTTGTTECTAWSLSWALNNSNAADTGDIITLLPYYYSGSGCTGKTYAEYSGYFNCGLSKGPITVRAKPGERVIINGPDCNFETEGQSHNVIQVNGSNVSFVGLEITNRCSNRVVNKASKLAEGVDGFSVYGPNNKIINCIVHDVTKSGISVWSTAPNTEIYGCLIYYNGHENSSAVGHALYLQSLNPLNPQVIKNNFVFSNFHMGIVPKALTADVVNGFIIDSNTAFNASSILGTSDNVGVPYRRHINFGIQPQTSSVVVAKNINVTNNVFYRDAVGGLSGENVWFGDVKNGVVQGDITFTNNYLISEVPQSYPPLRVNTQFQRYNFQGNILWTKVLTQNPSLVKVSSDVLAGITLPGTSGVWNNNHYFTNSPNNHFYVYDSLLNGFMGFAAWKNEFLPNNTIDQNSTFNQLPSGITSDKPADAIIVKRNKYDPNLYYVTVMNNSNAATVTIPIPSPKRNYSYSVYDVQNYLGCDNYLGNPVQSGPFNSNSIPNVPMNLTAVTPLKGYTPGLTPPADLVGPNHTSSRFNVFIVKLYPNTVNRQAVSSEILKINEDLRVIYPNPSKNSITLNLDNETSNVIELINNAGIKMIRKAVGKGQYQTRLDISKLKPGVYSVSVTDDRKQTKVYKLIKE